MTMFPVKYSQRSMSFSGFCCVFDIHIVITYWETPTKQRNKSYNHHVTSKRYLQTHYMELIRVA